MFCILKVMFNFLFKKKVFFGTNFLRSTQKKFIDQYNQFLEFYSIKPYNIFYGYNYYYKKLKEENFSVIDVDPYSISLLASLNSKEFKISKKNLNKKNTIIFGDDWLTKWFKKEINLNSSNKLKECIKYRNIILAYDPVLYRKNNYKIYNYFKKNKYILGKNIFLFQMVL